jgi:hypothetical protein
LAADLGYLSKEPVQKLMEKGVEVARLINGLLASFGRGDARGESETNTANAANSARKANQR